MLSLRASRRRLRPTLLLAAGAAAAILAGCGNDSGNGRLLTSSQAGDLKTTLSQIEANVAAKDCTTASDEVAAFEQRVDEIRRLDSNLRSALRSSSRRLETLVDDNCQATAAPPSETTTPDTGSTGSTGASGATGPNDKVKKEKPKKDNGKGNGNETPPGQNGQPPPGQDNGGGGSGPIGQGGD
jgi:outer membrane murein-binding lipoprotein Lpp